MRQRSFFACATSGAISTVLVASFVLFNFLPAPTSASPNSDDAQAQAKQWTAELSVHVKIPNEVSASPDGRRVAYTATKPVIAPDKSNYDTQVYTANSDGSGERQLTFDQKPSSNPQWSRDGKWLAFTSTRSGKNNLFLLSMEAGEARQLTDVATGVVAYSWSPDGTQIAFTMPDVPPAEEERRAHAKEDIHWVDEDVPVNGLYVIALPNSKTDTHEPRRLTDSVYSVGSPFWQPGFDWSPDGKTIVFTHTKSARENDWPTADISIVDVGNGKTKAIAATTAAETQPFYSPDGKLIAFTASDDPPSWSFISTINVVSAEGGRPRPLGPTPDSNPTLVGWASDGQRIYFSEIRGTVSRICTIDVTSGSVSELDSGDHVLSKPTLNWTKTVLGFRMESLNSPPEAFISKTADFAPMQISHMNAALPKLPLGKTELVKWKSNDGNEIEGLLTYPVDYRPKTRVPLLLVIHGGPSGVHLQTFLPYPGSTYPLAAFSAQGYAILRPNPRGSSGYGRRFRARHDIWGAADFQDLMTGVDHVIDMGVADANRLGVMGWSYGGFMTAWTVTHTQRFRAASMGGAITDQLDNWGNTDLPGSTVDYFGSLQNNSAGYIDHSPIFFTKAVVTPLLIQHGEGDRRVPISQVYEMFRALKSQGVTTRLMVLPRSGHGPSEPKLLLKVFQENLDWFDKYIFGQRSAGQQE